MSERMTKAELLELLKEKDKEINKLEQEKKKREEAVEFDFAFRETPEEAKTKTEKQARKDFIKRMTRGRWVSEDKYIEFMKETNPQYKPGGTA